MMKVFGARLLRGFYQRWENLRLHLSELDYRGRSFS